MPEDIPPWYQAALREVGVKEKFGKAENTRILQYHAATRLKAKRDEIPWCSSFVCFVMESVGITSTRSAAAKSWATWGEETMAKKGAVVFLGKADPDAGGTGHVCFFDRWDEDLNYFWALGGNQTNAVTIARKPTAQIKAVRWPRFS